MSGSANIMSGVYLVVHNLTEANRQASTLWSEFCTVQVFLGLGNLSALQNTGVSAFQEVLIAYKRV